MSKMIDARSKWLNSENAIDFLRLARHYEAAVQIVISSMVAEIVPGSVPNPEAKNSIQIGQWVKATAPARIDLSGAWTDTPPICFDFGGKTLGAAVTLDGKVKQSFISLILILFL